MCKCCTIHGPSPFPSCIIFRVHMEFCTWSCTTGAKVVVTGSCSSLLSNITYHIGGGPLPAAWRIAILSERMGEMGNQEPAWISHSVLGFARWHICVTAADTTFWLLGQYGSADFKCNTDTLCILSAPVRSQKSVCGWLNGVSSPTVHVSMKASDGRITAVLWYFDCRW